MIKKYRVTLEEHEREQLRQLLSRRKADVRRLKHAQIHMAADALDRPGFDGGQEARLIAIACSGTPQGVGALDLVAAGRPDGRTQARRFALAVRP